MAVFLILSNGSTSLNVTLGEWTLFFPNYLQENMPAPL